MPACRKALLIGICYADSGCELSGPHGDVDNVKDFLLKTGGFREEDIVVMKDVEGIHADLVPYRENILAQMAKLAAGPYDAQDSRVFYYSGHGTRSLDENFDEIDLYDECICPLPHPVTPRESRPATHRRFKSYSTFNSLVTNSHSISNSILSVGGQSCSSSISEPEPDDSYIIDDEIFEALVKPLPPNSRLFALFDSCHSGSILDLPCQYAITDEHGRRKHEGIGRYWEEKLLAMQQEVGRVEKDMVLVKAGILDHLHYGRLSHSIETALDTAHGLLDSAVDSIRAHNCKRKGKAKDLFDGCDALRAKKNLLIMCSRKFFSKHSRVEAVQNLRRIRGMRTHLNTVQEMAEQRETKANVILISGCKDTQFSEESRAKKEGKAMKPSGVLTSAFLEIMQNQPPQMTMLQLMRSLREKCEDGDYKQKPQLSSGHPIQLDKTRFLL